MLTSKPQRASVNEIAPESLNKKILKLLKLAAASKSQVFSVPNTEAKLFELKVLSQVLLRFKLQNSLHSVTLKNPIPGIIRLPRNGCSAKKNFFSYFELSDVQKRTYEAWISLKFTTISYERDGSAVPIPAAGIHELDVGIFQPTPLNQYPSYQLLIAGFSCKHFAPSKESVREALGLKRECAFLNGSYGTSTVPWLVVNVPTRPASPFFLVSSNQSVKNYSVPIDQMGVYTLVVPFP